MNDTIEPRLFLGVDGGGTRTRALLLSPEDQRCVFGEAEGCNPVHADEETVRLLLRKAIARAADSWNQRYGEEVGLSMIHSAFFGSAGFSSLAGRERMRGFCSLPELARAKLAVDMEMRVTLFGGLEGRPGISLIVGTGSACYAENAEGRSWQTGGWESLVSDEGGGYWIGLQGIVAAVKMADGRLPETGLKSVLFRELGISSVCEVIERLHMPPIGKAEVAQWAITVLREAENGDPVAMEIAQRGSNELAAMVETANRKSEFSSVPEVSVTGGGMRSAYYRDRVYSAIRERIPGVKVAPPALSPVVGAMLLALRQGGRQVDDSLLRFLKNENDAINP